MENVNDKIIADYRLIVSRLDIMKAEVDQVNRANNKLHKTFLELLEYYQLELDRRNLKHDRQEIEYYWLDKAGVLD